MKTKTNFKRPFSIIVLVILFMTGTAELIAQNKIDQELILSNLQKTEQEANETNKQLNQFLLILQ